MASTDYFSLFKEVVINDTQLKDIFKRITIKDKYLTETSLYSYHRISDGQTPDSLARLYYDDSYLYWLILIVNEMQDYFYDWPLTENELRLLAQKEYEDGIYDTGESVDDVYVRLSEENDEKRLIKYIRPDYLKDILFELNNLADI